MSEVGRRIIDEKYGLPPGSFTLGDGIDWSSPLAETMLYIELPFWLMMQPGLVTVEWAGVAFTVHVCPQWSEIFVGEVRDSRDNVFHQGPFDPDYKPPDDVVAELEQAEASWMERGCKTVLRIATRGHADAFRVAGDDEPPRAQSERHEYWASLCEAHIPVINELVQRYRLTTYDYFAYELSPWDVPVWYLKHSDTSYHAVLVPYKRWDVKPATIEGGERPESPGGPPIRVGLGLGALVPLGRRKRSRARPAMDLERSIVVTAVRGLYAATRAVEAEP